jgi:O-antigen/teichoic acid export membrane protein
MTDSRRAPDRHLIDGTVRLFLAESLIFPTGILTAAVLARNLSPAGYGQFTLAALFISWIEWILPALFSRAAVKLVGDSQDWRPIGAAIVQAYLLAGLACAILVWTLSGAIAAVLKEPELASLVRLFALDIPIFACTYAHRNILVGTGEYARQSVVSGFRWTARLLLIVLFVEMGFSIKGAVAGSIGASLVELLAVRWFIRPPLFVHRALPFRKLFAFAAPLFVAAISMRLFDKVDLFLLKILGASAAQIGYYGAAQNLALAPNLVALSLAPLLLSTLTRVLRAGDSGSAFAIGRGAMRAVICLAPFAAAAAGAAPEIIEVVFGRRFLPASPLIGPLVGSALALVMLSVGSAIVTAAGKPQWTLPVVLPLPLIAITAHLVVIPRWGSVGAAAVTLATALFGSAGAMAQVYRLWGIHPSVATVLRSTGVSLLAWMMCAKWSLPLSFLAVKLAVATLMIITAFWVTGEFHIADIIPGGRFRSQKIKVFGEETGNPT